LGDENGECRFELKKTHPFKSCFKEYFVGKVR
jgi:hypothetical protein